MLFTGFAGFVPTANWFKPRGRWKFPLAIERLESMTEISLSDLRANVRDVPDFPKPGILFKDITPLLLEPTLFRKIISLFVQRTENVGATKVAGIDARGFLFGTTVAHELGVGFVPLRKKGKLPYKTYSHSYELEYGKAEIEVHTDAFSKGDSVVLIDDLLATGGTAEAAIALIEKSGATLKEVQFVIELDFLKGREKLESVPIYSILRY